ncbi:MAG: hypothetical protein BA865_12205 [Desulfobacterales bacterium S5133MH4]|nr:MAG: hypothetical protein BA865_12205 [Desulfobacterales bacterium S5133MH4]
MVIGTIRNFSISPGKSYFATIRWIPAFAGMTGAYTQSSFRRKPESSDCYPDLFRSYNHSSRKFASIFLKSYRLGQIRIHPACFDKRRLKPAAATHLIRNRSIWVKAK